jgi:hypothetical protein
MENETSLLNLTMGRFGARRVVKVRLGQRLRPTDSVLRPRQR